MREQCPEPQDGCNYAPNCFSDCHHLYYPAPDYKTRTEKGFRELPQNKVQICRREHEERHQEPPPPKPELRYMLAALQAYLRGSK